LYKDKNEKKALFSIFSFSLKRFLAACREVSTYSPLIFRGDAPPEVGQRGGIMKSEFSLFILGFFREIFREKNEEEY